MFYHITVFGRPSKKCYWRECLCAAASYPISHRIRSQYLFIFISCLLSESVCKPEKDLSWLREENRRKWYNDVLGGQLLLPSLLLPRNNIISDPPKWSSNRFETVAARFSFVISPLSLIHVMDYRIAGWYCWPFCIRKCKSLLFHFSHSSRAGYLLLCCVPVRDG